MFKSDKFLEGQSVDLRDEIIELQPQKFPFSTLLLSKTVKANNPVMTWITEEINPESAVTMAEGADAPEHVDDDANLNDNNCELFGATATVSHTAQYSTAVGIADLLKREVIKKMKAIKMRMEDRFINGEKGFTNNTYTTGGILELIDDDNKVTSTSLTKAKFHDTVGKIYDAGVSDEMICFLPADMKAKINEFENLVYMARDSFLGFDADVYATEFGDVNFVLCRNLKEKLFIINPEYLELGILIPFHATPENPSGSKQSIYLETQAGIKLLNPKAGASFEITK